MGSMHIVKLKVYNVFRSISDKILGEKGRKFDNNKTQYVGNKENFSKLMEELCKYDEQHTVKYSEVIYNIVQAFENERWLATYFWLIKLDNLLIESFTLPDEPSFQVHKTFGSAWREELRRNVRKYGALKYGNPFNHEKVDAQRFLDALLRHLIEYLHDPQHHDKDSTYHVLGHIFCNINFLWEKMIKMGKLTQNELKNNFELFVEGDK